MHAANLCPCFGFAWRKFKGVYNIHVCSIYTVNMLYTCHLDYVIVVATSKALYGSSNFDVRRHPLPPPSNYFQSWMHKLPTMSYKQKGKCALQATIAFTQFVFRLTFMVASRLHRLSGSSQLSDLKFHIFWHINKRLCEVYGDVTRHRTRVNLVRILKARSLNKKKLLGPLLIYLGCHTICISS